MLFLYVFLSDCKCLENTIRKEIGFCILISLGKIIWTFTVVYFGCKKKKKKKKRKNNTKYRVGKRIYL